MSTRLMRIGELAERTGLSQPTIRHYDETGLLSPSARTAGNFRLYSEADYEKLMVIRRMKPLGFSVEEMRQLLHIVEGLRRHDPGPGDERAGLLDQLRAFTADATARRDRLQRNLDRADEFIAVLRTEERGGRSVPADAGVPPHGSRLLATS
jgi:DNA-binding transcriptional MerR regulator